MFSFPVKEPQGGSYNFDIFSDLPSGNFLSSMPYEMRFPKFLDDGIRVVNSLSNCLQDEREMSHPAYVAASRDLQFGWLDGDMPDGGIPPLDLPPFDEEVEYGSYNSQANPPVDSLFGIEIESSNFSNCMPAPPSDYFFEFPQIKVNSALEEVPLSGTESRPELRTSLPLTLVTAGKGSNFYIPLKPFSATEPFAVAPETRVSDKIIDVIPDDFWEKTKRSICKNVLILGSGRSAMTKGLMDRDPLMTVIEVDKNPDFHALHIDVVKYPLFGLTGVDVPEKGVSWFDRNQRCDHDFLSCPKARICNECNNIGSFDDDMFHLVISDMAVNRQGSQDATAWAASNAQVLIAGLVSSIAHCHIGGHVIIKIPQIGGAISTVLMILASKFARRVYIKKPPNSRYVNGESFLVLEEVDVNQKDKGAWEILHALISILSSASGRVGLSPVFWDYDKLFKYADEKVWYGIMWALHNQYRWMLYSLRFLRFCRLLPTYSFRKIVSVPRRCATFKDSSAWVRRKFTCYCIDPVDKMVCELRGDYTDAVGLRPSKRFERMVREAMVVGVFGTCEHSKNVSTILGKSAPKPLSYHVPSSNSNASL